MSHTVKVTSIKITSESAIRQAVASLQGSGVSCELLKNEIPRFYFADQLQKHLGRSSEVCDYVLRLHDSPYDVGFIKEADGSFVPVFDNFVNRVAKTKCRSIKEVLGNPYDGKIEHWSGMKEDTVETLHSISKFLMAYSVELNSYEAALSGHTVQSTEIDANGDIEMWIEVEV